MAIDPPRLRIAITLEQCWHRVPGGTARAAIDVVNALHERSDVELIGLAARHRVAPPPPWTPPIAVATLPLPRLALYEAWHRLRRPRVEVATGQVDVIHVTGWAMPPRSVPIVVTLHDLAFLRYPESFTRNGRRFFADALSCMRRDADLFLCSSDATREDAAAAGLPEDRLRVVPLGASVPEISDETVQRTQARLGITGRFVLQLGTNEPRKNRVGLLHAMKYLPDDVSVVFAGGEGWGRRDLPDSVDTSRVVDLGFVSEVDKHALLVGASVLCFPSFWEGFGLPVLEAMAHGTPVVTSAGTAMAEITAATALLVDPRDPDSIGAALAESFDRPDETAARAVEARRRAGSFTWENTARCTVDAYREVVGR